MRNNGFEQKLVSGGQNQQENFTFFLLNKQSIIEVYESVEDDRYKSLNGIIFVLKEAAETQIYWYFLVIWR